MKKLRWMAWLLMLPLLLTSCTELIDLGLLGGTTSAGKYDAYFGGISPVRGLLKVDTPDVSQLDLEYSERERSIEYLKSDATRVVFANGGSTVYGKGAESGGKDVTITSGGTYIVSGTAEGASLLVDAPKESEVHLVLAGVSISGKNATAIELRSARSVLLTLEGENRLSNYAEGKPSALDRQKGAVLLSRVDLCVNGTGTLSVLGSRAHGVASLGKLTLTGGKLSISTAGAGLIGETCVKIDGGEHEISAEEEGILSGYVISEPLGDEYETVEKKPTGYIYISGGTTAIASTGDAIRAASVFLMRDGVLDLTAGIRVDELGIEEAAAETAPDIWEILKGDSEDKKEMDETDFLVYSDGISAASDVWIRGGTLVVTVSNRALHTDGSICFDGGRAYIRALREAIFAEGPIGISDGVVIVEQGSVGLKGASVDLSGGYFYVGRSEIGVKTNGAFRLSGGSVCLVAGSAGVPLDFGVGVVTGGTLVALGNARIARLFFPTKEQSVIFSHFDTQGEAYPLLLCEGEGGVLLSLVGVSEYSCAYLSHPKIMSGNAYTLMSGGYVPSEDAYGFAKDAESSVAAEPLGLITVD